VDARLPDGSRVHATQKGENIAREVTERWTLREMTKEEQREWLAELYQRRNDAAREGRHYEDDINVSRLHALCWDAVSWAAMHLKPRGHGYRTKPCTTQEDALSDHSRP
jgi:hypothetical protein